MRDDEIYRLGGEREGARLHGVRNRPIQHPHPTDASVEGDADRAEGVVSCGTDLTSAPGAVLICVKQIVSKSLNLFPLTFLRLLPTSEMDLYRWH